MPYAENRGRDANAVGAVASAHAPNAGAGTLMFVQRVDSLIRFFLRGHLDGWRRLGMFTVVGVR
jgi:hypothetical protein